MKWRETVTMSFFPRTIAGLRPDQQRSRRSMTTVPAKPAPSHRLEAVRTTTHFRRSRVIRRGQFKATVKADRAKWAAEVVKSVRARME
jgi:hypothetical protein